METPSFGDAVISLTGYQIDDEKIRQACSTRGHFESVDDIDAVPSGSMSPDFGDVWRQGCPESPEWESELERDSADEEKEGTMRVRPQKCVLQDSCGEKQNCTVPLPNCGFSCQSGPV